MFDVFTNRAAIDKLAKNDRSLAQKIADKFKELLNVIKAKLKMIGETSKSNPEIKALMNDADSLEQIVNKFHDALDVAKNNYNVHNSGKDAGNRQKNNAAETAKAFSYSTKKEIDSYNIEKWNDYIYIQKEIIRTLKEEKFLGENNRLIVHNNHLNIDIEINFRGIKETLGKGDKFQNLPKAVKEKKIATIRMLPELLEKATIKDDDVENYHNEKSKLTYAYIETDVLIDGKPNKIILDIRKSPQKNMFWVHSVFEIKENQTLLESSGQMSKLAFNEMSDLQNNDITELSESQEITKNLSMNSSTKSLDEMKADRSMLQDEYRELKGQIDNLKASAEYIAFDDEIRKVRKNGSLFGGFEAVKEIRRQRDEWADEAGLTELQKKYHYISEQIHDYDLAIYKIEKEQKAKATEETAKKLKIPALSR